MPPKQQRPNGAVSDIVRPVRRAVLTTSKKDIDEVLLELKASVKSEPVAEPVNEIFEARIPPVRTVDTWARATSRRDKKKRFKFEYRPLLSLVPWVVGAGVVIAGLIYVSEYGLQLKGRVVQQGNAAIGSLMTAKGDLENFDIQAAAGDFSLAAEKFSAASREMDALGPGLLGLASKVPGLKSLSYGHDLAKAGELISEAGRSVTGALSAVSKAGGLLDPKASDRLALGQVFLPLKDALARADKNINEASALISNVPDDAIPENVRLQFVEFKERMPELKTLLSKGDAALGFLSNLMGMNGPRRYLILFQNSSELRPTGGFPGSYGLITFENGRIKDLRADDIYNPDGQIKDITVPPIQLQHITPTWGMRDSAWFIDFPTSARKVMEFYKRGGGTAVDGVIAIRPEIVMEMMRITGPISLPQYDTILTAENFLPTIQAEVESKKSAEPKKIIMDLAPILLQRIAALPSGEWLKAVQVISEGLSAHDVMMSFQDKGLQDYTAGQSWDGRVQQKNSDYLMIDISNIKGAKSDAVTDTTAKLESWLEAGTMVHRLTLTRKHNGGDTPYGFYNKTNYSYVRILVPKGSALKGVSGNDRPTIRPIMDYSRGDVQVDADLDALERTYKNGLNGAITFEESGKTGFGFWMKIEPGRVQQVQLEYVVPAQFAATNYNLYIQRQPGLDISDFEVTIQKAGGARVSNAVPQMTEWPDSWRLHEKLEKDLDISAKLNH